MANIPRDAHSRTGSAAHRHAADLIRTANEVLSVWHTWPLLRVDLIGALTNGD
jgi:hypothetical protein